jgi:hypothetical protein
LDSVLTQMVGRGPGLTPSGDDAMVGILAALHLSPGSSPAMARRLADALAPHLAGTTDISRHLLIQAGRGQIGRPLHELGRSLWSGLGLQPALEAALDVGATSGADACLGLVGALQHMTAQVERVAA